MDDKNVRNAVMRYISGKTTEAEAAEAAGIPRAQLRYYARTCGLGAVPSASDSSNSPTRQRG